MPDNLPQQVDVQLPPETSSVVVAKVVYGLHALSIIIGVVTGGSILGAFGFACLVGFVGFILSFIYVGLAIWFIGFFIMSIWVGYRIIRGAIRLWNAKPI